MLPMNKSKIPVRQTLPMDTAISTAPAVLLMVHQEAVTTSVPSNLTEKILIPLTRLDGRAAEPEAPLTADRFFVYIIAAFIVLNLASTLLTRSARSQQQEQFQTQIEQFEQYYNQIPGYPGTYPPGYEEAAPDNEDSEQQDPDKDSYESDSTFSGYWEQQTPFGFGRYRNN